MRPRLQSSIAASAGEGAGWVVFNASPDLRQQINETPELQPVADDPLRSTPIRAVVLTNADVDHIAGLLNLRERQAFTLYATPRVLEVLDENPIFSVLNADYVRRVPLQPGVSYRIEGPEGPTGIEIELFPVAGKVALFNETGNAARDFGSDDGNTVGVVIRAEGKPGRVAYVPGCAGIEAALLQRVEGADVLLFDGTVFHDNEMEAAGVGAKTGRRMGHVPIAGEGGSLAGLAKARVDRRIFIHINNTNPILDETSEERRLAEAAGWEVAFDGLEIRL